MSDSQSSFHAQSPGAFRFPGTHRLKSRKILGRAFEDGDVKPHKAWPLLMKIVPEKLPKPVPTQAAFAVSKRRFPRAVDRNRIKRLLREAWRHERHPLESHLKKAGVQWAIVFIFVGQEMPDAQRCRKALQQLIKKATSSPKTT